MFNLTVRYVSKNVAEFNSSVPYEDGIIVMCSCKRGGKQIVLGIGKIYVRNHSRSESVEHSKTSTLVVALAISTASALIVVVVSCIFVWNTRMKANDRVWRCYRQCDRVRTSRCIEHVMMAYRRAMSASSSTEPTEDLHSSDTLQMNTELQRVYYSLEEYPRAEVRDVESKSSRYESQF